MPQNSVQIEAPVSTLGTITVSSGIQTHKVGYLNSGLVVERSLLHQIELTTERSGIASEEGDREDGNIGDLPSKRPILWKTMESALLVLMKHRMGLSTPPRQQQEENRSALTSGSRGSSEGFGIKTTPSSCREPAIAGLDRDSPDSERLVTTASSFIVSTVSV
jgi:hypothetical protein